MYSLSEEQFAAFREVVGDLTEHRIATEEMAGVALQSSMPERGAKMVNCGTYLRVAQECGRMAVVYSNFCRQRLCPMCAWRRSLKFFGETMRVCDALSGYRFLHVVLTVENVSAERLPGAISDLYRRSRELFRNDLLRAWRGVMRNTEVTYNPVAQSYHPHLHCLVAVRPSYFTSRDYVSCETLQGLWGGICFMRRCADLEKAVAEVCKYSTKPVSLRDGGVAVFETLQRALHGRRLVQTYGVIEEARKALKIDFNNLSEDCGEPETGVLCMYWNEQKSAYFGMKWGEK